MTIGVGFAMVGIGLLCEWIALFRIRDDTLAMMLGFLGVICIYIGAIIIPIGV